MDNLKVKYNNSSKQWVSMLESTTRATHMPFPTAIAMRPAVLEAQEDLEAARLLELKAQAIQTTRTIPSVERAVLARAVLRLTGAMCNRQLMLWNDPRHPLG